MLESKKQGRWLLAMDEDRHNPNVSRVSLFVSSPGNVAHERRIAREIIARLNAEFAGRIALDAYFWEYEPFDFSKSFQEQIPNTATFDVVLCLLWSRLGSRLGASQRLPDGSPANSGTEYEITHALSGWPAGGATDSFASACSKTAGSAYIAANRGGGSSAAAAPISIASNSATSPTRKRFAEKCPGHQINSRQPRWRIPTPEASREPTSFA